MPGSVTEPTISILGNRKQVLGSPWDSRIGISHLQTSQKGAVSLGSLSDNIPQIKRLKHTILVAYRPKSKGSEATGLTPSWLIAPAQFHFTKFLTHVNAIISSQSPGLERRSSLLPLKRISKEQTSRTPVWMRKTRREGG